MVKLYYTPTSCGASSFISAFIAGLNFDCEAVDLVTHITESGVDFYSINQHDFFVEMVGPDKFIMKMGIEIIINTVIIINIK